ncbi:MAG TPA: fatty-acid oxidation protein subunit alpha [Cyanobacteria bacterium UBA11162]|nr:fatty-acid oxidation protein subunit alpha [Cyanobacteria bacterium UBA12227]HAX85811.1 fatty-acid oxidation protein subunit alpha [Cyanobacteria bacterium UBA11370]HBL14953.1 fatty-acid oxidation protein subunit alpha [Cyanobacteria bacterium UBA11162]HBY77086.1 fatty-acid oxidation protein subunit alpha [Cyanobacteria bacterium UBA11148]
MSAKDIFHNTVRVALEKDGWTITHEPLFLQPSQRAKLKIDLGAQKLLSAEKAAQKIAVEVKSFVGLSAISEFHTAVGQFLNYRVALNKLEPERVLYLAVPTDIYHNFLTDSFIQEVIEQYQIKLLVFHIQKQEIALWKS